jgi:hypothetical protein
MNKAAKRLIENKYCINGLLVIECIEWKDYLKGCIWSMYLSKIIRVKRYISGKEVYRELHVIDTILRELSI